MESPTERPPAASVAAAARRVVLGFGMREIGLGIVALGIATAFGVWYRGHARQNTAALQAISTQLALRADVAEVYRERFLALQTEAARMQAWANAVTTEPQRTWARERAREFTAFVAAVDQQSVAHAFDTAAAEVRQLAADGDLAAARERLAQASPPSFPGTADFVQLRHDLYDKPLAEFSRQNPAYYRALRDYEPEIGKQDADALRAEITSAGADTVTPQLMLKVDLLAAVAPADDPVVADWSTLTSAMDYFENPDGQTLARWRRAQHAARLNDWPTAVAEMQSIVISRVRTRQPFRAALGRALLRSRPDQPSEAYPYLVEAAAAGDKQARLWVAQEDYHQQRYAQAERWLEAAAGDGDDDGDPLLLELYQKHADAAGADPAHQAGVLQRVTSRSDAPADAWLMLGRLYERGDPPGSSAAKAFACYAKAAQKGSAAGNVEVARCALRGVGTPVNLDTARDAASQAFAAGERESAAKLLVELMRRAPDRCAGAVQRLFAQESLAGGGGYAETRIVDGPGVSELKRQLARYLDEMGRFGDAARYYAGLHDPAAAKRRAELTAVHPCQTCGGSGKVQESVPCPTCGGKGKIVCSYCGGTGIMYVPGAPPCPTCGGSGTILQDGKVVMCAACGGTGKGKGNVIKQDCPHCDHGYIRCPDCTDGFVVITKECPDCHGRGTWTLVDRAEKSEQ